MQQLSDQMVKGKSSIIKYLSGDFSGEHSGFVQFPQGIRLSFVRQIYDNRGYLKDFATEYQLNYELIFSLISENWGWSASNLAKR